jgi:hypothetical protein
MACHSIAMYSKECAYFYNLEVVRESVDARASPVSSPDLSCFLWKFEGNPIISTLNVLTGKISLAVEN